MTKVRSDWIGADSLTQFGMMHGEYESKSTQKGNVTKQSGFC